jgi:predicted dehydrogenase
MTSVAVVGTGSAGCRHLSNLLRLGVTDVVAVSEHRRRTTLMVDGTSVPVSHDYDSALTAVDAVVIANPTSLHDGHLRRAIDAGRHALCEKPVSVSAVGVADLVAAATARRVTVAVGCQFRFNHMLGRLRELVIGGTLGTILDVDASLGEHLADYHPDEDYRLSYAARRELGGGVLLTQIHQLDYLHWIFGPFDRVFAVGGHVTDLEIDVEDSVTYLLRSQEGVGVRAHLDYIQRPKRAGVVVTGTGGQVAWDYQRNELRSQPARSDAEPLVDRAPFDRNEMFLDLMADFLASIRLGRAPRTTLADAAAVLALVDAVKESLRTGAAVVVCAAGRSDKPAGSGVRHG